MREQGPRRQRKTTAIAAGRSARRGSAYLATLGLAMLLTLTGLVSLAVVRINVRAMTDGEDWAAAQCLARSGAEHALLQIENTPNWRSAIGAATVTRSLGGGSFQWKLVDEGDGDLADDPADGAVLLATGAKGVARYTHRLQLAPTGEPLEVLKSSLAANGSVEVERPAIAVFVGAGLFTNAVLTNNSIIFGNVTAKDIDRRGLIIGRTQTPGPTEAMPPPSVFDLYRNRATVLAGVSRIDSRVLSPAANPWGTPDPDGLYYIDTGGQDLVIQGSRLCGTLVVKCKPGKCFLKHAVLMESYRADYPVLIVDGDMVMEHRLLELRLREGSWNTNFNPPGTPYRGCSDSDKWDSYPNAVRGLVHVTGDLNMERSAFIHGTAIVEGAVTIQGACGIIHRSSIVKTPPVGYTSATSDKVRVEGWSRSVE